MNSKTLNKLSQLLILLLVTMILTNACTPPATRQDAQINSEINFQVKQVGQIEEDPDPLDALPTISDPEEEIVVIAAETEEPIQITVKRRYPKNMSTKMDGMEMIPASLTTEVIPAQDPAEYAKATKKELRGFRRWLRDYKKHMLALIHQAHREILQENRTEMKAEVKTLPKSERKEFGNAFNTEQKALKASFKSSRKEIRKAHHEDQQNLKAIIKEIKAQQNEGFSTKFIVPFIMFAYGLEIGKAISKALFPLPAKQQQQTEKEQKQYEENNPVPVTTKTISAITGTTYDANNQPRNIVTPSEDDYKVKPEQDKIYSSDSARLLSLASMLQNAQSFKSLFPAAEQAFAPVHAFDILRNLKDSAGNPILPFTEEEKSRYSHCLSGVVSSPDDLPEGCEYALVQHFNEILFTKIDIEVLENSNQKQNFLDWLSLDDRGLNKMVGQPAMILTVEFGFIGTTGDWLAKLLTTYFSENGVVSQDNSIDDLPEHLREKLVEVRSTLNWNPYIKLTSPEACKEGADLIIDVPGIASMQAKTAVPKLLFEGEYFFEFGLKKKTADLQEEYYDPIISDYSLGNLAETLNLAPYQIAQRAYVDNQPNQHPLKINDTQNVRKRLEFQIDNDTANLYDVQIDKIYNDGSHCLFYKGECIYNNGARFRFGSYNMSTGLYQLSSQYSRSKDKAGNPVKAAYLNAASNGQADPFAYKYVVLNGMYSSFVRKNETPEHITLEAQVNEGDILGSDGNKTTTIFSGINTSTVTAHTSLFTDEDQNPTENLRTLALPDLNDGRHGSQVMTQVYNRLKDTGSDLVNNSTDAETPRKIAAKYNLLADLIDPSLDSFGNQSANQNEPGFLHVGAVVSFTNRNFKRNETVYRPDDRRAYIPMKLQVVQNGAVYAEWAFNAYPGTHTIVQKYWDGKVHNVDNILNEDSVPEYLGGDYEVRVVQDDSLLLLDKEEDPNFNFFYLNMGNVYQANTLYPILAQPESPTRFGESSSASVNISSGYSLDRPILWAFIDRAEQEFPDVSTQLASLDTETQYALVDELYQPDFSTAQLSDPLCSPDFPCPTPDEEEQARQYIQDILELQQQVNTDLSQLKQYRYSQVDEELVEELRERLLSRLENLLEKTRFGLINFTWSSATVKQILFELQLSSLFKGIGLGLLQQVLTSGNDLKPVHEQLMNSFIFVDRLIRDNIMSRVKDKEEDIVCDYMKTNANIFYRANTSEILQKNRNLLLQELTNILLDHLSILDSPPYNITELQDLGTETRKLFTKTYKFSNVMDTLCSKCLRDDVANPPRQVIFDQWNEIEQDSSKTILDLSYSRAVNKDDLQCRVCNMNEAERDNFSVALKIRQALRSEDILLSEGDNSLTQVGFKPNILNPKTIGFSWLKNHQKLVVAFSGRDYLDPSSNVVGPTNEDKELLEKYQEVIRKRIAKNIGKIDSFDLTEEPNNSVILSMEASSYEGDTDSIYPSLKASTNKNSNQNDAEIKILETIPRRRSDLNDTPAMSINIFSDRVTCPYCQEVAFRANQVYGMPIWDSIHEEDTTISHVTMTGMPLLGGEWMPINKNNNMVQNILSFIENINISGKESICQEVQ